MMALMLIGAATDVLAQEYITEVMTIGAEARAEGHNEKTIQKQRLDRPQ